MLLIDYCRKNKTKKVIKVLANEDTINILEEGVKYLHFAAKYKNTDMMEALVKYFYEVQLPQINNIGNIDLKAAKVSELKEIITEVKNSWEITDEVQKVIDKYLIPENNEEKLEDNPILSSLDSNYKTEYSPKETLSVSDELPNNFTIRNKKLIHESSVSTAASDNIGIFFNMPKIDVCNDDFSIGYSTYLSQPINDTCLGNSDISTRENTPEKELSGDIDANTTAFDG